MNSRKSRKQTQIREFWNWFANNHKDVEAAYVANDSERLNSLLTNRIKSIQSELCWELGPYHDPDHTLVISPASRDNLSLAEQVVVAAPSIAGWHFLSAKPPKRLTGLVIQLPEQDAEVCADNWVYRLTSYNHGEFFDIEVFTDAPPAIKDDDLQILTHKLIESLIGERLYLERVGAVTTYRPTDPRSRERTTKFPLLYKHLCDLLSVDRKKSDQ